MEENEILCDRPCAALRACGRHQCRRICCPLASLANIGKKSRRRLVEDGGLGNFEHGGLHECDLVCGKMLSCGNHKCEERDHKGICRPCMRSSFEEVCLVFFPFIFLMNADEVFKSSFVLVDLRFMTLLFLVVL